jgi:hypothetical protein
MRVTVGPIRGNAVLRAELVHGVTLLQAELTSNAFVFATLER